MPLNLSRNLLASLVLFLIAIPLNLGISLASGVSPSAGLITGIISGLVLGVLAGCPLQISGPATGLIAVVWQIIETHGLGMLGPIVLLSGILQICLGFSKWAPWFRAVSPAVIQGMLAGIGILIFASQLQVVLERKPQTSGLANLLAIPEALEQMVRNGTGAASAGIGAVTVLSIVLWRVLRPKKFEVIPGSLIGVGSAVLAAGLLQPNIKYVDLPENPLTELAPITLSALPNLLSFSVLWSAVALAFIATAQTLLTATAVDRLHSFERTDYNKEIFAQGVANTICGSLNLLPVCGVIVRSSANLQAGATNRSSNLMHGVWVGLFTLFLASWLEYVPLAALAGVLVYTGYRLVDLKAIQDIKRFGNAELAIYIITLVSVVMIDLLSGIVLGFVLSAARLIYVLTHFDSQVRTEAGSGSIVIELNGSATFFTLPRLADELTAIPPKREVHLFMSGLNHIDHACLEHLMGWEELYISRGGQVFVEWDHLINRFHRPLTREIGMEIESASTSRKSHETYDILAARAQIVDVEKVGSWRALAEAVALSLDMVPKYQGPAIVDGLVEQFETERFLIVSDVLIPHLMIAGIPRHEMVLVRTKQGMGSLDPKLSSVHCMVALIGPPRTSEHLNILARLSNRAEDGLARDVALAESRAVMRRLLLKHSRFVSIMVESERPSAELIGRAVWQIAKQLPPNTLIAQIYRADSELIPGGSTVLQDGDKILVLGSEAAVEQLVETYIKPLGLDDPPPTGAALRRPVETEPTPD